jgi:hypothetical protein
MATNKQRNSVQKLVSNTNIFELENLGTSSYKTKCKWEHKIEKLAQKGEQEEKM